MLSVEVKRSLINGDKKTGLLDSILYFPQCIKNHKVGEKFDNVIFAKISYDEEVVAASGSVSRILSNLFWNSLDWSSISESLGRRLHFFDIGCGSGRYGFRFRQMSGGSFGSYTGLDMIRDDAFPDNFTHVLDHAENAHLHLLDETNIVVSQSALEHIYGDLDTLVSVTQALSKNKKPFLQIHLVPAPASLWLYFYHGWRQYSVTNIGEIASRLKKYPVSVCAVPIGGPICFFAHFKVVLSHIVAKWLGDRNTPMWKRVSVTTREKFRDAARAELHVTDKLPLFWAIIIRSKDVKLDFIPT